MNCKVHPLKHQVRTGGFTLIEIIASLALLAFIMTTVAVTISSLNRVNRKLRNDFPAATALVELGARLRADAHSARQATLVPGNGGDSLLQLTMSDQTVIEYSAKRERVLRRVLRGDHLERQGTYSLARGSELEWINQADSMPVVKLTIRSHVGPIPAAADNLRVTTIVAAIGLDSRQ